MAAATDAVETILIVDDEQSVRQTFQEWLEGASLGCEILTAEDAEAALRLADRHPIDLAILDWNLGAGNDGLELLEDLFLFNRDVVAIMVTGYAHQATPLTAMRMGIRDYLDKNQDLDRETFLTAVRRQLDRIRPAKRERRLHQGLIAFREAVDKVLPLVRSAAALTDPVPFSDSVRTLLAFLLRTTGARDGVLIARSFEAGRQPEEVYRAYDAAGASLEMDLAPFAHSIAASAVSLQEPSVINRLDQTAPGTFELQPFEQGRRSLLAAPIAVAPGTQVILELFDKQGAAGADGSFTAEDQHIAGVAADLGAGLFRQVLAERQTHQVLLDAVAAALRASDSVQDSLRGTAAQRLEEPPPAAVLDQLREGLRTATGSAADAEATLRLAEAIRVLALRHGSPALHHCLHLIESLRELLDSLTL
jgi:DNA-binding response OmpR family regulator